MKGLVLLVYLSGSLAPLGWMALRAGAWADAARCAHRIGAWFTDAAWLSALARTAAQAGLAAGLALVLALPAAVALTAWRGGNRRWAGRVLWFARVVPPVLLAVPFAALAGSAPVLPGYARVAIAHLVFNVPVATAIVFLAASRRSRRLAEEARQDGLWPLQTWRRVWWPSCRGAGVLALLWCFAASFTETALTVALQPQPTLATFVPGEAATLDERASAALASVPISLGWGFLLGVWWMRTRRVSGHP
ncbi:MAG: hypothetical protein R3F56_03905 [Planctomycetota bacterium]